MSNNFSINDQQVKISESHKKYIIKKKKGERMGYIGAHGVAALQRYKYSGVDNSYLAKYVLQPFWSRFVNFFPLWMP